MSRGTPGAADGYVLVDSGHGRKLEQVGPYRLDRQAAQAFWSPGLGAAEWDRVAAVHHRSERGGGHWETRSPLPGSWMVAFGGLHLQVKPTPFGHLGLFAEQAPQWAWLRQSIAGGHPDAPPKVLNLFAYTGGATLACLQAGAEVCHVDAAKGIVDWARQNAEANGLHERPVRWIVEDCTVFLEREIRRGHRYDALLLDPPSFGRGARKEVWKIEDHLPPLLDLCRQALSARPRFILLTAHSPGFTPLVLANLLASLWPSGPAPEAGEMTIPEAGGRLLPSGAFARIAFPGASGPA